MHGLTFQVIFPSGFPTNTLHAEVLSHFLASAEEGEEVAEGE